MSAKRLGGRRQCLPAFCALLCVSTSALGCAAPRVPGAATSDDCSGFDTDIERMWGVDAKARVRASAVELGAELAATTMSRVTVAMDRISSDWVRMRGQLCRDHARTLLTADQYAARSRCLDDALIRMRTFSTMLQSGGLRDPEAMTRVSEQIDARLEACGRADSEPDNARGFVRPVPREMLAASGVPQPEAGQSLPSAGPASLYARSLAVVIGIDDYRELPDLRAGEADARAVAKSLQARGFKVELLLGAAATRSRIAALLGDELPRKLAADDRVLVFFAGHGVSVGVDERAMGYLMPWDAQRELPVGTGVSMTELQGWLAAYAAKHVMFVADACYSGLALPHRGVSSAPADAQLLQMASRERVRFTLVAGQDNQEAWEMAGERRGAFTYFLLQALEGDADDNHDGLITGSEVTHYVEDRVFSYVWQQYGNEQRPTSARSGRGEFIFFSPAAAAGSAP